MAGTVSKQRTGGMFGHDWQPGQATIVALKEVKTIGNDAWTGAKLQGYEYVADVQPDGPGAAFRTVMSDPFDETHWLTPRIGDVLPVKCDPGRQTAKFDTASLRARDKAQKHTARQEQEAQFDAARHATPGEAPSESTGGASGRLLSFKEIQAAGGDPAAAEALRASARAESSDTSGHGSIEQRLAKLQQLRDDGVLTPQEYSAQRQRVLDSL
jgi:Short C-terminal domain